MDCERQAATHLLALPCKLGCFFNGFGDHFSSPLGDNREGRGWVRWQRWHTVFLCVLSSSVCLWPILRVCLANRCHYISLMGKRKEFPSALFFKSSCYQWYKWSTTIKYECFRDYNLLLLILNCSVLIVTLIQLQQYSKKILWMGKKKTVF